MTGFQPEDPQIELVEGAGGQVTLFINGEQAMQGWERDLMWESADILCTYGSQFLEVGLGLGFSSLRIAANPATRRHVVIEKYQRVIDLFRERHPSPPPALEIVQADFFEHVHTLEPASLDGIFFDPWLGSTPLPNADALWGEVVPLMVRALRPGGAVVPFFTMQPTLRPQFAPHFDRVIVERRAFTAYPDTGYAPAVSGHAFIQCFVKLR